MEDHGPHSLERHLTIDPLTDIRHAVANEAANADKPRPLVAGDSQLQKPFRNTEPEFDLVPRQEAVVGVSRVWLFLITFHAQQFRQTNVPLIIRGVSKNPTGLFYLHDFTQRNFLIVANCPALALSGEVNVRP